MKNFRDLNVWKKSHELVVNIYHITTMFPDSERYGLTSQIRRSASFIPANIAEGCGREGDKELRRFLNIASGSASETEYHLLLARDLTFLSENVYIELNQKLTEIRRMLNGFIKKLTANS